jgi:hypothetical protein
LRAVLCCSASTHTRTLAHNNSHPLHMHTCHSQELFSRIRKDLLKEMKGLKPGDR